MTTARVVGSPEPLDDGYVQVRLDVPGHRRQVRVIVPPGKAAAWARMGGLQGIAATAVLAMTGGAS